MTDSTDWKESMCLISSLALESREDIVQEGEMLLLSEEFALECGPYKHEPFVCLVFFDRFRTSGTELS